MILRRIFEQNIFLTPREGVSTLISNMIIGTRMSPSLFFFEKKMPFGYVKIAIENDHL